MIKLDVHKKDGFIITWPYHPDPSVRYAYINKVKQTAGFAFDKSAGGWVSHGPEVLLDMDRIDLWPYITEITPQAAARAAGFRAILEGILEAKHQDAPGEYGYQKAGTETLVLQDRGLLADDMGLGKSKQALDAAARLDARRILIVSPKTLTHNWLSEIQKWYPRWHTHIVGDTKAERAAAAGWIKSEDHAADEQFQQPVIMIINYEKLRLKDWPFDLHWDIIILDEAQKLKNTATQLAKAARRLKTDRMWALTGTPMEIRIEELYGIMSLLRPSVFGNYLRFREQHLILDAWGNVIGPRNLELLKDRIAPWMIRRKKEDVLKQLPPKLYNTLYVELAPDERKQYDKIKREFLNWLAEHDRSMSEANALTQLLRLQQFTCSPNLFDEDSTSSKYETLVETIKEWDGRVMVFSRFSQMAERLLYWLCEDLGPEMSREALITGDVNSEARVDRIARFNAGELGKVFVSTDAGAYGLNVTGADLIIHYDQLWNVGKMWQREDRLHRIGQQNPVNVLNLICSGTVDEGMLKVLEKRREIFIDVIDGAEDKALSKLGSAAIRKIVEGRI